MLLTLSSELCTASDILKSPSKFSNRLPFPLIISEGSNYNVKLEGISINPWPTKPVLICADICEKQPCGKNMMNCLAMAYKNGKFTQPKVPTKLGQTQEIVIEVKTLDDIFMHLKSVTLQLSLLLV